MYIMHRTVCATALLYCLQHCKAGDYTSFWSVFAKFGKVFSEEAQALLQTMLVFDPAQRVSFEDISKDPWLKGTTYSAEQLEVLLYTYTARVTRLQLLFTLFCFLSTADCCSASSDACDSVSRSWRQSMHAYIQHCKRHCISRCRTATGCH